MTLRRGSWLVAALLLVPASSVARAIAAPPTRAALEHAFESAMAAQHWAEASEVAEALVRRREAAEHLQPERAAALLDSLGRRLFFGGTPEAWAAAERPLRLGLERRQRAFGPDHPSVAGSLTWLSALLDYLGRWAEAIPLAERAVAIRTRVLGERHPDTAASERQLGSLRLQLGDYAGAVPPLERSLVVFEGLGAGYEAKVADVHSLLGESERGRSRLGPAETHFLRGLEVARAHLAAVDPIRIGLENNLAGLYKDIGRLDEAEPLLETALATLERENGDPGERATARLNLAEVQRLQGRASDAAPVYARALEEARAALGPGHPALVEFLNQSAVCEQELGHFARAESLYLETGRIVEAALGPDHPLLALNLGDLARLRLASGHAAEADSLLGRALALRERSLGPSHPEVALLLVEQARTRAEHDPEGEAAPLARAIGILNATRAFPEARLDAYALRAERQARLGHRHAAIADMGVALASLDSLRSWRGGGDESRAAFLASRLDLVDRMVGWQLEQGDVAAALQTHERGRARVLLDQIAASGVDLRAGIPEVVLAPLAADERAAEARLAGAHRDIQFVRMDPAPTPKDRLETLAALGARADSAALDLALARRRIADASPLWREVLSSEGRIPDVSELQRVVVPKDGMMLVYHLGPRASHVFAVPARGKVQAFPLVLDAGPAATLGAAPGALTDVALERIVTGATADSAPGIATLLSGLASGGAVSLPLRSASGPDPFELRLHALWGTLVPAALWSRLRAARSVVVIPDGALDLVAFEALVTRPRGGKAATTRYWLDDGPAVAYGPSASSLRSLALRPRRASGAAGDRTRVLSVSDVAYATRGAPDALASASGGSVPARRARRWKPLPGTAAETEAIRTAFGADHIEVLRGEAAREPAVRAALAGPRYVHLATHGFADVSGERVQAGLVLAPGPDAAAGNDDDGVLELFEIYRLPLASELAVLSACETAKGPRVAGEGAFALSRGFLAAGSRRVVASLWAVDDQPTARVMGGLFGAIAAADAKGRSPDFAVALRDAKRRVRDDPRWADPFYWAPFVLSGR